MVLNHGSPRRSRVSHFYTIIVLMFHNLLLSSDLLTVMAGVGWKDFVDKKIKQRKVVMFAKSRSPACIMSLEMLKTYKMDAGTFEVVNIEKRQDVTEMETYFHTICLTDNRDVSRRFKSYT